MKKTGVLFIVSAFVLALFAGCAGTKSVSAGGGAAVDNPGKLSVCASFYPMYDFASKIGGDRIEMINMVPAGTEPHDWEPSATDITNLEKADVFIYNGAGMEHWAEKVLDSLQNKNLIAVEASNGLTLLEGHGHEEESAGEEDHEDEEEHEEEAFDPHVWLSPQNAKGEMEAIKNAFSQADPENKDYYEANFSKYAAEFDALDSEFKDTLSAFKNRDIIVAHQAFGYLCADYGLNQVAIEGLSADSEPDPARMAEIIRFAKEHDVKVIFFEELVSPKVAETIASAIGAETDVLNPIEGLSDEQLKSGDDYFSVMRQNLAALKAALE